MITHWIGPVIWPANKINRQNIVENFKIQRKSLWIRTESRATPNTSTGKSWSDVIIQQSSHNVLLRLAQRKGNTFPPALFSTTDSSFGSWLKQAGDELLNIDKTWYFEILKFNINSGFIILLMQWYDDWLTVISTQVTPDSHGKANLSHLVVTCSWYRQLTTLSPI